VDGTLQERYKGLAMIFNSPNAWINADLCKTWLRKVWKPYKALDGTRKVLIWDQFSGHKVKEVEDLASSIGEVKFIPAGCTDLMQPLDTHINRTVKARLRKCYTKYIERNRGEEKTKAGNLTLPSFDLLIDWILEGILKIKPETIKAAFDHCGKRNLILITA
jgi:hypothetical protein